ncbi:BREX-1 system adenine-specific DNA-methyltransferase PglX [Phaeodactylibacter xiamenensis]|uniref:BREX-1 system adenine-specific DNA-methyltransferase PglX n=1 Tax=Phaeodactylibacter xiamenensis TaxID=1524460 RepID=UPI0024A9FAC4|nr:BREX-1 system adenine-specific DNA-methyltransferase PglX [Phaeodactylibacter xiamenensis]
MQTTTLKSFAQDARRKLIEQISNRLEQVLRTDSLEQRERKQQIDQLKRGLEEKGKAALVEEVAYTWFNRLVALRFMDANDYTRPRVLSPADGETLPEILQQAKRGLIEEDLLVDRKRVLQLLNGELPSADPQNEAYQLLLIAACNQWHRAMPFMFQRLQDYTELLVPNDLLSARSIVQDVREGMSGTDAQNVEIIGWLYQFYISEKKDAVFAAKGRVAPADLPAATQLFTPRWIVEYMVQNTLGKLWLQNRPNSGLRAHMPYYIDSPAAQAADFLRIESVTDIRFLDQACGSGHILLYAFELLTLMYEEEGYGKSEIPQLILQHNLRGFEIDERAAQLAGFALMMKARGYYRRIFRKEARPHILQFQDLPLSTEETAEALQACGLQPSDALRTDLEHLQQATNLGSLIQPQAEAAEIRRALQAVAQARATNDVFLRTRLEHLHTALQQLQELGQQVHCVVDNPPYMGGGNMNKALAKFVKQNYPASKSDLMACFMESGLAMLHPGGYLGMINQHSWMFLSSYEKLREQLIQQAYFDTMLHLGPRAFPEIGGEVVQSTAFTFCNIPPMEEEGIYLRLTDFKSASQKEEEAAAAIETGDASELWCHARQQDFQKIPGSPIGYWVSQTVVRSFQDGGNIDAVASTRKGMASADNQRFVRSWYEASLSRIGFNFGRANAKDSRKKWFPYNDGGAYRKWFGNNLALINWQNDGNLIQSIRTDTGRIRATNLNLDYIFKKGVTWTAISSSSFSARFFPKGFSFSSAGFCLFSKGNANEVDILGVLNSKVGAFYLKLLSPTLNYNAGDISQVPFKTNNEVEEIVNDSIIVSKSDWDAHETSWDFQRHPLLSGGAKSLSEAYAIYQAHWREQFAQLHAQEEALNRIFIDLYGLQAELSPEVPLEDITILQQELDRKALKAATGKLSKGQDCPVGSAARQQFVQDALVFDDTEVLAQFLSYAVGCMMGRYSLDQDGLILANAGDGLPEYWAKTGTSPDTATFLPDEDGIIPLLAEDYFPDDVAGRFRRFLEAAFGPEQFEANLQFVEKALGRDIRSYFVREFYKDHLQRYKKRPIYWLFSSPGKHFQALVYVHRYRPDTVSRLLNDYVRDFIRKLEAQRITLVEITLKADGSPREQTQAQKDIDQIDTILEDVRQYERDILYPLAARKLPLDLDDGVLVNYNKMGRAVLTVTSLNDAKARKKVEGFDWVDFDWGVVV